MFYSSKYNILFIACPKTGSTSVEKHLLKLDPEGETYSITLSDEKITGRKGRKGLGHAKAGELKSAIGADMYNKLSVFGFIREPFDRLVSTYFYSKQGVLLDVFKKNNKWKFDLIRVKTFLSILSSKILPFNVWVFLFPMKPSFNYFFDKDGKRITTYIGRTKYLQDDLNLILSEIGIDSIHSIPHTNKSNHKSKEEYYTNSIVRYFVRKRYRKDFKLYDVVEEEMNNLRSI